MPAPSHHHPAPPAVTAHDPSPEATPAAGTTQRYPLLSMLDDARGHRASRFTTDPHAPQLEARARELTDEYWPSTLWLTGCISTTLLEAVTMRLEAERQALRAGMRVFVAAEPKSRIDA